MYDYRLPSYIYILCSKPSDRTEMLLCAIVVLTGGQATGGGGGIFNTKKGLLAARYKTPRSGFPVKNVKFLIYKI